MGVMLEVKDLKKSFTSKKSKKEVLKGVSFEALEGQIFALLGSNGSGKTTAINIMVGLEAMDSGNIKINGYDIAKEADKIRHNISLTGQFSAVDEVLTGYENLELIAHLRKIDNPGRVVQDLLEKISLAESANRPVAEYSGGMKRRIDIAMSLIGAPKVIFLDEPTTGLDPEARQEIYDLIKDLVANGTTIFLTTQYLEEAEILADQIAILHEGVIVANGTFDQLKASFPKPKVEMIEKQPTLEEIFLAIVKKDTSKHPEERVKEKL